MKKIMLLVAGLLHAIVILAQTRAVTINGLIKSHKGEGLFGVVISSKNSHAFATSGKDGGFAINLPVLPDTLSFRLLGYEPLSLPVFPNNGALSVFLEPTDLSLQEVVVNTGYQSLKPNEINGSVVVLDQKILQQQVGTNILDRLAGVTSGLAFSSGKSNGNPQNNTHINIRGLSTINGPLDPLIVLDNFIYEGDIANINPNDVENVTVLKDAAAASIWGARAGNGVIVITTKKGGFNQDLKVGFSANVIVAQKPDLLSIPQMKAIDYIAVEELLFKQGYFNDQISSRPYSALTPAVEVFRQREAGLISSADSAAFIQVLSSGDSRKAYLEHFYRQALTKQYALNLRGGGAKNAYTFSAAYDNSLGETYDTFKKLNLRTDNTFTLLKGLQLNLGAYYTGSMNQSGRPQFNSISIQGRNPVYLDFVDRSGQPISVATTYSEFYTDTAGASKLLDWRYYPLEDYKHNTLKNEVKELFATTGLQYRFTPFLKGQLLYQYQQQTTVSEELADEYSYFARDRVNTFSQLNRTTGVVKYIIPLGGIRSINNSSRSSHTARAQLNANHSWRLHSFSAIAGAELREASGSSNSSRFYGYHEDPLTYGNVDVVNNYPDFITGNLSGISAGQGLSATVYRFVSLYGNGSWMIKDRYNFSASFRKDGSNIFGASTNDKWKPLWSVGAGWEVSKEGFYDVKLLPFLRLSATLGYSGNVDLSRSSLPVAVYATYAPTGLPFTRVSTINNPGLRWEQLKQINLRLDFAAAKQRLSGVIEYYHKKGTDLYGQTPYDYTSWGSASEIVKNVAEMSGNGMDVQLNSINLKGAFHWNTTFLFNYNRSITKKYDGAGANNLYSLLGGGSSISPIIGKPLYAISAYRWGGLDGEGNPRGFLNGELSTDYEAISLAANTEGLEGGGIIYMGAASPEYFGSFINSFSWKQFSLVVNIGYKLGYFLHKPSISYTALVDNGSGHQDYENRWKVPGDEKLTHIPAFVYPNNSSRDAFYNSSEVNVISGNHIRLQYLQLAYEFTKLKMSRLPFSNLQLYSHVANLGIIWRENKDGLDPDRISYWPETRTWAFGLRTNF
jgi:TonB-linked SusC/RagA family outer membrane protein